MPAWRRSIRRSSTALARTRLKPKGYVSQWLPAYQVPGSDDPGDDSSLHRRVSADSADLGRGSGSAASWRERLAYRDEPGSPGGGARRRRRPHRRICAGWTSAACVRSWAPSSDRRRRWRRRLATRVPVSDDQPLQEYGVKSLLNLGEAVPGSIVDLSGCAAWCPSLLCRRPAGSARGRPRYLSGSSRPCVPGVARRGGSARGRLAEQQHRSDCRKRVSGRCRSRIGRRAQPPGNRTRHARAAIDEAIQSSARRCGWIRNRPQPAGTSALRSRHAARAGSGGVSAPVREARSEQRCQARLEAYRIEDVDSSRCARTPLKLATRSRTRCAGLFMPFHARSPAVMLVTYLGAWSPPACTACR